MLVDRSKLRPVARYRQIEKFVLHLMQAEAKLESHSVRQLSLQSLQLRPLPASRCYWSEKISLLSCHQKTAGYSARGLVTLGAPIAMH